MFSVEKKNKWQIRVITFALFLLGFVAGGFTLNAYNVLAGAAKQQSRQERYQEAFDQLNLTEAQKIEVQQSVAEIRENIQQLRRESEPRMQEIRDRNDARLQKILTADQWKRFQAMRESIRQSEK